MEKHEIEKQVQDNKEKTRDELYVIGDIDFLSTNRFEAFPHNFTLSNWALNQLLMKVGIPISYYKKCSEELQLQNYLYWQEKYKGKTILVRQNAEQTEVRAILGKRYNLELDDIFMVPLLLNHFENTTFSYTPTDMCSLTTCLENESKITLDNGMVAQSGCIMVNSEVGYSALQIRPYIQLANGLSIYDNSGVGAKYFYHTKVFSPDEMKGYIEKAIEIAQFGLSQVDKATQQTISEPQKFISQLQDEENGITKGFIRIFEEEVAHEKTMNKYDFMSRLLGKVQDLPVFQKHLLTTKICGRLSFFGYSKESIKRIIDQDIDDLD